MCGSIDRDGEGLMLERSVRDVEVWWRVYLNGQRWEAFLCNTPAPKVAEEGPHRLWGVRTAAIQGADVVRCAAQGRGELRIGSLGYGKWVYKKEGNMHGAGKTNEAKRQDLAKWLDIQLLPASFTSWLGGLPEVVSHMASAGLEHGEAKHRAAGLKMLIRKLAFRRIA